MEQQGIMSLGTPPQQGPTGEQLFEAAKTISPDDYAKGTMESLRLQDPESAAIVDQIMSMQLPADLVEGLLELLDIIFQDPQNYPALRQESIAAGVPEVILPPEFDIEYFAMLQMALRAAPRGRSTLEMPDEPEMGMMAPQMSMPGMGQAPQRFAMGGEVSGDPKMKMVAQYLQNQGRYGDTMLAHITPSEAAMLRQMGGSGTINPVTGLPEFNFLKKAWNKIKGGVKKVGKAIEKGLKSLASGIKKIAKTPLGKIAIGVGLAILTVATGGAAAIAAFTGGVLTPGVVAGAVGGMGASILAGDKGSDVIKNGIIGGFAGYGAGYLGAPGFSGTGITPSTGMGTGGFLQTAQNAGSAVYQGGKELVGKLTGGSATAGGAATGPSFLSQTTDFLKSAKDIAGVVLPAVTLASGGFDPAETSPEDLEMGFQSGQTPTQNAMDLIAADPERYRVNLGEILESRTQDPFGQANAGGISSAELPSVGLPSLPVPGVQTPQMPLPGQPAPSEQMPSEQMPSEQMPYASEMMYDPRAIALAEQYNIDVARGFAQGGIAQRFARGGPVRGVKSWQ